MTDRTRVATGERRSVGECLDGLHQNIEGMVKVPRMPRALRLMLTLASDQIDELRFAIERDLPTLPPEPDFARPDVELR